MTNDKKIKPSEKVELRRRAEDRLSGNTAELNSPGYAQDSLKLVHELEVHRIELEMQHEELQRSRDELEVSRNTYAELYDFAPIGYFTFDAGGLIKEVNFLGANLLGMEKGLLTDKPFSRFIPDEADRKVFSDHLAFVMQREIILKCEITLAKKDGTLIHGRLQSVGIVGDNSSYILTAIVDETVRKQLEEELRNAHDRLETAVRERTGELTNQTEELTVRTQELSDANVQLMQEIEERRKAEAALQESFEEIRRLKNRLQAENVYLQEEVARQHNFGEIIGRSAALTHIFTQVDQVAEMDATVLILGETGTGKGLVARAIHSNSARRARPLITVNCATLPATLVESELFGRERGAFTGSDARQIGRFELADGGTIFLDEIGDLPPELQSKLLRVIQDGEFERLGSPRTLKSDVRIIAATNRKLEEAIRNGSFREDLYYRLNMFPITVPPLRQRSEDIPLLVNHFVAKFNKKTGRKIETISKDTLNALQKYSWPGNVRELESVVERAVITSRGAELQVLDRFETFSRPDEQVVQDSRTLADLERDHILQTLWKTGWRVEGNNGAAALLDLNPSTLRARMRKYGIKRTYTEDT